jgi:protein TonB
MGPGGAAAAAANDTDVVPLVRVNPQYPARAMQRGIEGWVHLEFTITEAGTTKDIAVVEADPVNVFEAAAVAAVRKYKYKPKVEQGQPVERPGVAVMLSFKLHR